MKILWQNKYFPLSPISLPYPYSSPKILVPGPDAQSSLSYEDAGTEVSHLFPGVIV